MSDLLGIGAVTQGAADAYGAYAQQQTAHDNLVAQQQHNAQIQQYINQYLQPNQSPYSQAALNFVGATHAPGSSAGGGVVPGQQIGGYSYSPSAAAAGGPGSPLPQPPASIPAPAGGTLTGAPTPQGQAPDWLSALGYTNVGGAVYNGAGQRLNDQQVAYIQQQIASGAPGSFPTGYYGPNGYTAYTQDQINQIRSSAGGASPQQAAPQQTMNPGTGTTTQAAQPAAPQQTLQQMIAQLQGSSNPQTQQALASLGIVQPTTAGAPGTSPNGLSGGPSLASIQGGPSATEVPTEPGVPATGEPGGGIQDGGGTGNVPLNTSSYPGYTGAPNAPSGGGIGTPGAYQYQDQGAYTYNPTTANAPPQAQVGQGFTVPQVTSGTQGQNAGQDALMQMLRRNYQIQQNPELDNSLRQQLGGAQFDNTGLFSALKAQNAQSLDQQVNALQGSAGSLGQRFGTALGNNEALLRSTATTNEAAQLAQLQSQSYENAQNRQIQAIGLGTTALQNTNQNILTNQAQQLQAATSAGQLGAQQQGYDLQASQSNASNALQQGLASQQQQTQTSQFNSQQALQQALQNAGILNSAGQFNAAAGQTAQSANTQQGNIYNQLMLQALGQAQGAQAQQTGQNTSLIGLLAGLSVPQANTQNPYATAAGSIGQLAQLYPFLQQLQQQGQT